MRQGSAQGSAQESAQESARASSLDQVLSAEIATWPVGAAGVVALDRAGVVGSAGDVTSAWPWASVTKLLTALTALRAAEADLLTLDDPAGPPGATVRHLLSHASGLAMDSEKLLAAPGKRRVYSNRGIELAAAYVAERSGRSFADLVTDTVLDPLGMAGTTLPGSPAHGARGPVTDLARLARELLEPRTLSPGLVASATATAYPGLSGVLPGFGRQEPNDWGLGFEIRGRKTPHWTSPAASPVTFGHFGQSGSFLWVDPEAGLACCCAGDTPFGPWAAERWPVMSSLVLADRVEG